MLADLEPEPGEANKQTLPLASCPSILPPLGQKAVDAQNFVFPTCKRGDGVLVCSFPEPGLLRAQLSCSWFLQSRNWNGDKDPGSQPASQSTYLLSTLQASPLEDVPKPTQVLKPFFAQRNGGSDSMGGCTRVTQHICDMETG